MLLGTILELRIPHCAHRIFVWLYEHALQPHILPCEVASVLVCGYIIGMDDLSGRHISGTETFVLPGRPHVVDKLHALEHLVGIERADIMYADVYRRLQHLQVVVVD